MQYCLGFKDPNPDIEFLPLSNVLEKEF